MSLFYRIWFLLLLLMVMAILSIYNLKLYQKLRHQQSNASKCCCFMLFMSSVHLCTVTECKTKSIRNKPQKLATTTTTKRLESKWFACTLACLLYLHFSHSQLFSVKYEQCKHLSSSFSPVVILFTHSLSFFSLKFRPFFFQFSLNFFLQF